MALNTCETWSNRVKTAFFFKKLRKIAQRLGVSHPDPHSLPIDPGLWYLWISVHFFTQHVSQFRHFHILTISLNPSPYNEFLVTCQHQVTASDLPFYSMISLPPQKIPLSDFLMTSLHVICGLSPPPIKNPGYACKAKTFFFWSSHTFGLKTNSFYSEDRFFFFFGLHLFFGR